MVAAGDCARRNCLEFQGRKVNPFRTIWVRTDPTLEYFLKPENRRYDILHLIWISAFAYGLNRALATRGPFSISIFILVSVFVAVFLRFIAPWMLFKTGTLFKGKATIEDLRVAVSLSSIPALLELFYLVLVAIVPGEQHLEHIVIYFASGYFWIKILTYGVAKAEQIPRTHAFVLIFLTYLIGFIAIIILLFILTSIFYIA